MYRVPGKGQVEEGEEEGGEVKEVEEGEEEGGEVKVN